MKKKEGRHFRMPTAYSILLILIAVIAVVSHLIPGVRGATLPDVVMAIPRGFLDAIDVCLFILILGGFLGMIAGTGALDAGIAMVVRRFQSREMVLIPILMFLFSIGGTTYGMAEETMAFYALITATMVAAGFDAMVGAAVVLVGAGVGVLGSTVNPFAVSAAIDAIQGSSDIVINQGLVILLGVILWLGCLAVGIWYVMRYARRVKKSGRSILTAREQAAVRETYSAEQTLGQPLQPEGESLGQTIRSEGESSGQSRLQEDTRSEQSVIRNTEASEHSAIRTTEASKQEAWEKAEETKLSGAGKLTLVLFAVSFLIMVISLIPWSSFGVTIFENTAWLTGIDLGEWYFQELQAWFLIASIAVAFGAKLSERDAIDYFVRGAADMIGVVFVIAVSRAISVIMRSTGMDLYVLSHAANALNGVSPILFAVMGFVIYLGLSILIPSTSGLAAASMPTFGGLTAGLGLSPEVMIMIFCAASGVVNLVTPTSAVVMGGLSICRIEWPTWLRFVGKLLILFVIISLVVLSAAMLLA